MLKISRILQSFRPFSVYIARQNVGEGSIKDSRQEILLKDFISKISEPLRINSTEINQIKEQVIQAGHQINANNFPAVFINCCLPDKKLGIAKSYYEYLKSNSTPNNATIAKLLRLYYTSYADYEKLPETVESEIYDLCNSFQKRSNLLDAHSSENAISALSLTKEWRKCLEYLDNIKFTSVPTHAAYSHVVVAALKNNELDLGWSIFENMLDNDRVPTNLIYSSIIFYLQKNKKASKDVLNKIFTILNSYNVKASENFVTELLNSSEDFNIQGSNTVINKSGKCQKCKNSLPINILSSQEFDELRNGFYNNVIVGKNIYTKSTPGELDVFKKFVEDKANFDVVIDGLNVAYSAGIRNTKPIQFCQLMAGVVKHFVEKNQRVLLIGRVHMEKWRNQYMSYIMKNSSLFLAQNLSQDDPFLLYAAMHSGPNTGFVSRDQMRGHAFKLSDPKLKQLFYRWQQRNQYDFLFMTNDGKAIVKNPLPYLTTVQKCNDHWHLPFEVVIKNSSKNNDEIIFKWTCIKLR